MEAQASETPLIDWNARLRKFTASLLIVASLNLLTGCGYQGWMRYPCQEFENWEKPECNPPRCLAVGQCTKDLIPDSVGDTDGKTSTTKR
jgi:predicted small lipoprotein YifL